MDARSTLEKMDYATHDMIVALKKIQGDNEAIASIISDLESANAQIDATHSKMALAPFRIKNNNHVKQSA